MRSRRIFEDLSRNFQQAQGASRAANQQRMQQGAAFGQLGQLTSGIGGTMAGLGGQTQQLGMQDVSSTLGIGGLQQQQLQRQADVGYQNQLNQMMEPYRRLSFGTQSLQQLTPGAGTTQQTISPVPQGNPYLQAAGAIGSIGTKAWSIDGLMAVLNRKLFNRGGPVSSRGVGITSGLVPRYVMVGPVSEHTSVTDKFADNMEMLKGLDIIPERKPFDRSGANREALMTLFGNLMAGKSYPRWTWRRQRNCRKKFNSSSSTIW